MISAIRRILSNSMPSFQVLPTPPKLKSNDNLVWIDCEMTGLEVDKCHIVEIACIITNEELKVFFI